MKSKLKGFLEENEKELDSVKYWHLQGNKIIKLAIYLLKYILHNLLFLSSSLL